MLTFCEKVMAALILIMAILTIPVASAADLKDSAPESKSETVEKPADFLDDPVENEAVKQSNSFGHKLLWYFPDRFMDLLDCFTLELGANEIGAEVYATRLVDIGANIGYPITIGWTQGRKYGIFTTKGWQADFFNLSAYELYRSSLCGNYNESRDSYTGFATIENCRKFDNDPCAIGGKVAVYLSVKFQVHPVEIADFLCGLVLIDFQDDDF